MLALLAVLGVWFDAAGPVGHGLSWLLHGAFGLAAVLFPIVGIYWGFVLLRDVAPEDRVRMFIGFTVMTIGVLGILSLARGNPSPFAGYDGTKKLNGLAEAGGLFGALAAYPLSRVLSPIGAGDRLRRARLPRAPDLHGDAGRRRSAARSGTISASPLEEPATAQVLVPDAKPDKERQAEAALEGRRRRSVWARSPTPTPIVVAARGRRERAPHRRGAEPSPDKTAKPRTITTSQGPYQLPSLDLLRTAPPSTADGTHETEVMQALGPHAADLRGRREGRRRPPRAHRHDVRGRGRVAAPR